jgi:hypothetical protein
VGTVAVDIVEKEYKRDFSEQDGKRGFGKTALSSLKVNPKGESHGSG